jgi:hypothetical protein
MAAMRSFEIQSDLAIPASEFLSQCCMQSVNWELAPIVRMTAPRPWQDSPIANWEVGSELFKSWILLFGLLPVDRHAFRLRKADFDRGFDECSSSWMNREWNHCREIRAHERGCTVIDRVAVVGRVPLLVPLLMPIYRFIFRHRHCRLRKKFRTFASPDR